MKLLIKKYKEQNYNCAEIVLRAANDHCGLGIAEADFTLISGFGGGMCSEGVCGVVTAGIAALGKLQVQEKAHESTALKASVSQYIVDFQQSLGSINCKELKAKYKDDKEGCLPTVLLGAEVLQRHLKKKKQTLFRC